MATLKHNISGALTKELLESGQNVQIGSISFANTHATDSVGIDLYMEKKLTGKFYFFKGLVLPAKTSYVYEPIGFNNSTGEFGLFIKLSASTSTVDVIIS